MAPTAIVLLGLLALASAAPQCSTSCAASAKYSIVPGTSYVYAYTGTHTINIDGIEDGSSTSDLSATVTLTVVSPCDVAISLQDVAGSNFANAQQRQVEKYPLMVSLENGKLEKVCSHPADAVSSINVKKAIASAFQNVLPSLEPTLDPQVYTEDDIVGSCPTKYIVEDKGDMTVVTKEKVHSNCQNHYYDQTRTSFLPSETPLPIQDSRSSCVQEIANGFYTNVRCKDTKQITPGFGIFKVVMAAQEFSLQLLSETADSYDLSSIDGPVLNSESLRHQQELPIKNPNLIERVDAIMPEICTLSQGQSNKEVASLVAQTIELLRFVPDDIVVEVLDKIRAGAYCADYTKLESLFLDAVAFVGEPGAFKVMAQEIAAGRTTGGRFSLYTVAVNLLSRPTFNHVAALIPIFGMVESNQLLTLASSSVVNRYCTQNVDCDQTAPVKRILSHLSAKLDSQCTPEFSNVDTSQVLTTLKTFGNIGKSIPQIYDSVMKCVKTEGIETNVRFAAAMSFKGLPCEKSVIEGLKTVALDASMNTEVRIGSYLSAVRCAEENDLEEVINVMSSESNKQVQAFILSHLENLQETNWPLKQYLRERLASKNIPKDYMTNTFKYSRNVEMSVNTPVIELGGLVESNIVYTPESYVPRLVNLGLNMNLLGSFVNIGEVGVRVEGLDPYFEDALGPDSTLYKEVFGPDSYLYKTPLWSVIEDSKLFMTQRGKEILQQIQTLVKENNINHDTIFKAVNKILKNSKNINVDSVLKAFNRVLKNVKNIDIETAISSVDIDSIIKSVIRFLETNKIQLPKTDLYAIIRAQERAFLSFGGEKKSFTINELVKSFIPVIMNAIDSAKDLNVDTARTGQINIDYSIPTISGIPLKLKLTGTAVAGIQLTSNLNVKPRAVNAFLKIIPSLNAQIEGQIGFGELLNTGLKLRSTAYTTNGFALTVVQKNGEELELQVDLPEKMELFDIGSEMFFMKLDEASNEIKLIPSYIDGPMTGSTDCMVRAFDLFCYYLTGYGIMKDVRMENTECSNIIEPVTGLLVCYKMNLPDLINSEGIPLVKPMMFKMYLKKSDAALKGYLLTAKLKNKPTNKFLKIVGRTYGTADSTEFTWRISYAKEQDKYLIATKFLSTFLESRSELTFINQPEVKSIQYYTSFDSTHIVKWLSGEGSVKVEYKPSVLESGATYEVATYAGFKKSLDNRHRLFQVVFSLFDNGDNTAATVFTKTDLLPVALAFEAGVELPNNAGLRFYKVEKISLRLMVSSYELEALLMKKSTEMYQTVLNIKNFGGSAIATFDVEHVISIESPLTGFTDTKLNLRTYATAKLPNQPKLQLSVYSKLTYENGIIESSTGVTQDRFEIVDLSSTLNLDSTSPDLAIKIGLPVADVDLAVAYTNEGSIKGSSSVKYMNADVFLMNTELGLIFFKTVIEVPNKFYIDFYHTMDRSGVTTVVQVEAPTLINPIKVNNVFEINEILSYSLLTDIKSGGSVILLVEGPLIFGWDMSLSDGAKYVQRNLDLKITGAFDGAFNVISTFGMTDEELQYTIDVSHTSTPIVFVDVVLDKSNAEEVAGKANVNIPFVIESEFATTISLSLIHSTMNALVLPSTDYARRFKGYADFNYFENNFKGELYWDADKDNEKRIGLSTEYSLDLTALNFWLEGELTVTTLTYGYVFESVLASPLDWFQGKNGLDLTVTLPSKNTIVHRNHVHIMYTESQVGLKHLFVIYTSAEDAYELTSAVVVKLLPAFLNFDVTYTSTLSTPQLKYITLVSNLVHEDKDQSGKLAFMVTLKESVLSKETVFEYKLESAPGTLKETVRATYGEKEIALIWDLILYSGLQDFKMSQEIELPFANVKYLKCEFKKYGEGNHNLDFLINDQNIVSLNYIVPVLTDHTIGITFPSRAFLVTAMFARNQVTFQLFPDKSRSDKVVELTLRLTPKAGAVQFETLLTAPSLSKEMRFAVEVEPIEYGNKGYDMVSVDVQYQVSEARKLLKATLNELQSIYGDLINDGLIPDLNELYKESQRLIKQLPKILNNITKDLMKKMPKYYKQVKNYVVGIYQLYEADLIALLNKIQSECLMYWNIIKTEVPVLLENYVEIIKKTETWNAVQSILNEVMLNYPAYYSEIVYYFNEVIVPYLTDLSETVSRLLVLPEFDFLKYWAIVINDVPDLFIKFIQRVLDSQLVQDLKKTYPTVFEMAEDFYYMVLFPTYTDLTTIIQFRGASVIDILSDLPAFASQSVLRFSDTQIVRNLRDSFPTLSVVVSDVYYKVILPTFSDVLTVIQKLNSIPVLDIQESIEQYWNVIKVEVPTLFNNFVERMPITQVVSELKAILPTLFEVSEDFYNMVVLPTTDDVVVFVDKLLAVPVTDLNKAFKKYWNILKVEVPTLMSKIIQRIPNTQAMNLLQTNFAQLSSFLQIKFNEQKDQYPELYAIALDLYNKVAVPAISDLPMLYNNIIQITDIYQLRDFIAMDVLSFVNNLLNNISTTDLFSKLMAVFDQLIAAYPAEYDIVLKTYKQITEVTVGNVISAINSYLFEKFGMSFSVSSEKFTAIIPLPVSIATLRDYYQLITVRAPAYVTDVVLQGIDQGRLVYQYFEARLPVVIDYINTQGPVYLQYVMDYVQMLPDIIFQFIDNIDEHLDTVDEYLEAIFDDDNLEAFFDIIFNKTVERYYKMAYKNIPLVRFAEKTFEQILTIIFSNLEQVFYNVIYLSAYISVYTDLIVEFATWAIMPVLEYPPIKTIYEYIVNSTDEKIQADLERLLEFVMEALGPLQIRVNELIGTFAKEIPYYFMLIKDFIESVLNNFL